MCYRRSWRGGSYGSHGQDALHILLDHDLEVDVDLDALRLVELLSLGLQLPEVFHLASALFPVLLEPLDLLQTGGLLLLLLEGRLLEWSSGRQGLGCGGVSADA